MPTKQIILHQDMKLFFASVEAQSFLFKNQIIFNMHRAMYLGTVAGYPAGGWNRDDLKFYPKKIIHKAKAMPNIGNISLIITDSFI